MKTRHNLGCTGDRFGEVSADFRDGQIFLIGVHGDEGTDAEFIAARARYEAAQRQDA